MQAVLLPEFQSLVFHGFFAGTEKKHFPVLFQSSNRHFIFVRLFDCHGCLGMPAMISV